jgi:hypothetical protein
MPSRVMTAISPATAAVREFYTRSRQEVGAVSDGRCNLHLVRFWMHLDSAVVRRAPQLHLNFDQLRRHRPCQPS